MSHHNEAEERARARARPKRAATAWRFVRDVARAVDPSTLWSLCGYLCSGPYGVPGTDELLETWLAVLPVLVGAWVASSPGLFRTLRVPRAMIFDDDNDDRSPFDVLRGPDPRSDVVVGHHPPHDSRRSLVWTTSAAFVVNDRALFERRSRLDLRWVVLLSPLAVSLYCRTVPVLVHLFKRCSLLVRAREPPLPSMRTLISTLAESGRIQRTPRYDVYLPPPEPCLLDNDDGAQRDVATTTTTTTTAGLVLVPGYLVSHESYASIAHRLSNHGVVVAVLSLEPFRVPLPRTGANLGNVADIDERVRPSPRRSVSWNVGGHSAGGYAAMRLVADAAAAAARRRTTGRRRPPPLRFHGLVLWGSGNLSGLLTDLSNHHHHHHHHEEHRGFSRAPRGLRTLVLEATRDPLGRFDAASRRALRSALPNGETMVVHETIQGGNHGGYAEYRRSALDGERTISLERQHRFVAERTAAFLKSTI